MLSDCVNYDRKYTFLSRIATFPMHFSHSAFTPFRAIAITAITATALVTVIKRNRKSTRTRTANTNWTCRRICVRTCQVKVNVCNRQTLYVYISSCLLSTASGEIEHSAVVVRRHQRNASEEGVVNKSIKFISLLDRSPRLVTIA